MRIPGRRIKLADLFGDLDPKVLEHAQGLAAEHHAPIFDELPYTESNPEWVLLRLHATRGQIRPGALKRMRTVDLEYLAGMPSPHPLRERDPNAVAEEVKVVENAIRAQRVLDRRAAMRQVMVAGFLSAAVGGAAGGAILLLFGGS